MIIDYSRLSHSTTPEASDCLYNLPQHIEKSARKSSKTLKFIPDSEGDWKSGDLQFKSCGQNNLFSFLWPIFCFALLGGKLSTCCCKIINAQTQGLV